MPGLMRVHCVYDRTDLPSPDTAITTHHFVLPIVPPSSLDYNAFETSFATFWDAIDGFITDEIICTERRYYLLPETPGTPTGAPDNIEGTDRQGASAANKLPPQVSFSVTEETDVRRRWGRFYIPGFTVATLDPSGAWSDSVVETVANAAHDWYETMASTSRGFATYRRTDATFQLVNQIRCDNVPDIIRRRRFSAPSVREIRSIAD